MDLDECVCGHSKSAHHGDRLTCGAIMGDAASMHICACTDFASKHKVSYEDTAYNSEDNRSLSKQIVKDITGLLGENIQGRQEAIVEAHLNTIRPKGFKLRPEQAKLVREIEAELKPQPKYKAYFIIWLDVTKCPPRVYKAGIYSEPTPTSMHSEVSMEVFNCDGPSYDAAEAKVAHALKNVPAYKWCDDLYCGRFDADKLFQMSKAKKVKR